MSPIGDAELHNQTNLADQGTLFLKLCNTHYHRRRVERDQEEAEEANSIQSDEQSPVSEEDGEDLLEGQERDYRAIPELDVYERDGIDEEQYSDIDE